MCDLSVSVTELKDRHAFVKDVLIDLRAFAMNEDLCGLADRLDNVILTLHREHEELVDYFGRTDGADDATRSGYD